MREFEGLAARCKLDSVLGYMLWGEESVRCAGEDPEAALDIFWDEVEAQYPNVSRYDNRFFSIVTKLTGNVEEAFFKAGFSLAQEIRRAAEENN